MSNVYLYSAPNGVPGSVTRTEGSIIEPADLIAVSGTFAQAFGIPMKYVAGGISQYAVGDTASVFAGILIREVPSIAGTTAQSFTSSVPNPVQIQGLMRRGYVSVVCTIGTPVRGGAVYVRVVASGGAPGDIEATADGVNNVLIPGMFWATDGKDASNNAEVFLST